MSKCTLSLWTEAEQPWHAQPLPCGAGLQVAVNSIASTPAYQTNRDSFKCVNITWGKTGVPAPCTVNCHCNSSIRPVSHISAHFCQAAMLCPGLQGQAAFPVCLPLVLCALGCILSCTSVPILILGSEDLTRTT